MIFGVVPGSAGADARPQGGNRELGTAQVCRRCIEPPVDASRTATSIPLKTRRNALCRVAHATGQGKLSVRTRTGYIAGNLRAGDQGVK